MDFNYLYHRQQVSLMRADVAACGSSRAVHQDLARLYGDLIERKKAGATAQSHAPAPARRTH